MHNLNAEQREAAETINGPLLILAGAGSGKTRVITYRIAHLIENASVQPWQILAVTFTNKAAGEMKARVQSIIQPGNLRSAPLISTFHALCVRILRRDIERLQASYTRNFTIYDTDDQARVVRGIMKDQGVEDKTLTPRSALSGISWAKNRGITPAAYLNQSEFAGDRRVKIAQIYEVYQQRLQQSNALDFDDLLIKAVLLLRQVEDVRTYYHERYRHVMIDEFQDTNGIQYELARLIAVGSNNLDRANTEGFWDGRSLCVVGDIDQSIYAFRGSDFNIILNFRHDFTGTKIIKLEQNYRSTQTILEAANRVIAKNTQRFPKNLFTKTGQGDKIRYYQSYDGEGEASFVAEKIQDHLRRDPKARVAVLYRTNSQSRLFEESLRRRSVGYNIVGGFSFYERAEVKDIIAYLKLAMNPNDDVALGRVVNTPPRGIGKTTLDALTIQQKEQGASLWETIGKAVEARTFGSRATTAMDSFRQIVQSLADEAARNAPLSEVVKAATLDTGYVKWLQDDKTEESETRLFNIEELVSAAVEGEEQGETLRDFIDHAALASDTDQYKEDARVTLMTVHSAKGLEFPAVFIVGLEEGLFPHSRTFESEEDMEEERRLCYVAITRAQTNLYLTHAMKRRTWGEEMPAEPSRFLNEVPLELIQDMSLGSSWLGSAARPESQGSRGAVAALRGPAPVKKTSNYEGKTYNSAESVREFFTRRAEAAGNTDTRRPSSGGGVGGGSGAGVQGRPGSEIRSAAGSPSRSASAKTERGGFAIGARVRHSKYGMGVVMRTEGFGEDAKLTVNFPGHGQKKFVAKFAALERI